MSEKYYVISGNYQEYNTFIRKKCKDSRGILSLSHFVYVQNKESFIGVKDPTGWLVGTWRERPDIRDVIYRIMLTSKVVNETLRKILDELNEQHTLSQ